MEGFHGFERFYMEPLMSIKILYFLNGSSTLIKVSKRGVCNCVCVWCVCVWWWCGVKGTF